MKLSEAIKNGNWTVDVPDTDALEFSEKTGDGLSFRKQVIYVGDHQKGKMKFSVDEKLIDHWVKTGADMLSNEIKIPLPKRHSEDVEDSRGVVTGFEKGTDSKGRLGLFMFGKFRDKKAAKMMKTADVSLYSPVKRQIGGVTYQRPLTHVALTDYPVIRGLDGFARLSLSYEDTDLELEDGKGMAGKGMAGKGMDGKNMGKSVRKQIQRLMDNGWTLEEIADMVDSDSDMLGSIRSGEIKNPPQSLLMALMKLKAKKKMAMDYENGETCPVCAARRAKKAKKKAMKKKRMMEEADALSEDDTLTGDAFVFSALETAKIDKMGKRLAKKFGSSYAAKTVDGDVLVCAEVPEDCEAYFAFSG